MSVIDLPVAGTVALNVAMWTLIHGGVSYVATRPREDWPKRLPAWSRVSSGEARFYERALNVRRWKGHLPDAAPWFKDGFSKRALAGRDPEYLQRFVYETLRSELAHWVALGCFPLFFLWSPVWVGWLMAAMAVALNVPCVLVQRYNRARLNGLRTVIRRP
jgi:glycosyl-4,4'-diaponeurosporenoate acyltransferase